MSKAFTREDDEGAETAEGEELPQPQIPQGTKNYITPAGYRRLQDELLFLVSKERPQVTRTVSWAAENGDRSENADYIYGKRRLREIDRRMRFLEKRMEAAEVVDPLRQAGTTQVFFGATVTILDEEKTYSIVGVDELDLSKNRISWVSPLARALLKHEEGDVVTVKSPKGPRELEIVKVEYKPLD